MTIGLNRIAKRQASRQADADRQVAAAERIYLGANPVQRQLIDDKSLYIGGLCPRRAGKTFAVTSKALHLGEERAGSRILIISLTLKSTVENYWSGSPGGLWAQNAKYDLGIKFNTSSHTWVHQNGSRGLLAGAETKADIEHLRGAAAEADIVIIDECKSFAPAHLQDLIENVVEPGLMTRNGQLVLIGTPGSIPLGPFYAATCVLARTEGDVQRPTCIPWQEKAAPGPAYALLSEEEWGDMYTLHTWTMADNVAVPGQWARALSTKRRRGWDDDHPTWRREYLGQWVSDAEDLVYSYTKAKAAGLPVTWVPDYTFGPTGLNPAEGPWHILLGLDLGYNDDSAMVLVAYSETLRELRQVYGFKAPGMHSEQFVEEVLSIIEDFGQPDMIVADFGGGGAKMILEGLNQRFGLSIQRAEKTSKSDHIELMNGDFMSGRIRLIPSSDLEHEICGLQWDLSNNAKHILARTGKLREDPSCPNHLCDALLYAWRFAYHYWSAPHERGPEPGSPEWYDAEEQRSIDRYVARKKLGQQDPLGLTKIATTRPLTRESLEWTKPSTSRTSAIFSTYSKSLASLASRARAWLSPSSTS